jgi:hypothetical protein
MPATIFLSAPIDFQSAMAPDAFWFTDCIGW